MFVRLEPAKPFSMWASINSTIGAIYSFRFVFVMILLGISQCLLCRMQFSASLLELEADGLKNKGYEERRESFVCFPLFLSEVLVIP